MTRGTFLLPPEPPVPAIEPAPRQSRRERWLRLVLLLAGLVAVAVALTGRLVAAPPSMALPSVSHAAWVLPHVLMRGAQPRDPDLASLRDLYEVAGVVNLRRAGTIEEAVIESFGLDYLGIDLEPGRAPGQAQLEQLVAFVEDHAADRRVVYLQDETGLDRAPAVGIMLAMLRGVPPSEAYAAVVATGAEVLITDEQVFAINALAATFGHEPMAPPGYEAPAGLEDRYRYEHVDGLIW